MRPAEGSRFGILHHPKLPHSYDLAQEVTAYLEQRGMHSWMLSAWDPEGIRGQLPGSAALITLGGDGTILRAARATATVGVPILAVNLGRLGFLAEVPPAEWRPQLQRVLDGDYRIEERMMLSVEHRRNGELRHSFRSLNEAVVGRGRIARVVRMQVSVDEAELAQYVADGLISATPTGSTAYAFAAGGPIMPPTLRNILLVPLAPMFGPARPIVLSEGSEVHITVETDHEAILTCDGQSEVPMLTGDEVVVRALDEAAQFVRLRPPAYFYQAMADRFRSH